MIDIFVIAGFIIFTALIVKAFLTGDFKGLTTSDYAKSKTDELFSIIESIMERIPQEHKERIVENGERFANSYLDNFLKSAEKTKKRKNKVNEFYRYSAVKLEGELIYLICFLKKHKEILNLMEGIKIPEEYLKLAEEHCEFISF